jgi:DNA-directed RNA polymerase specialized sigma subunit
MDDNEDAIDIPMDWKPFEEIDEALDIVVIRQILLNQILKLDGKVGLYTWLYFSEGYSNKQIADNWGISSAAVSQAILRGLDRLRTMLLEHRITLEEWCECKLIDN